MNRDSPSVTAVVCDIRLDQVRILAGANRIECCAIRDCVMLGGNVWTVQMQSSFWVIVGWRVCVWAVAGGLRNRIRAFAKQRRKISFYSGSRKLFTVVLESSFTACVESF